MIKQVRNKKLSQRSYPRFFKWATPENDGIFDGKVCCPCCGYPTLNEWGGYEICALCWWEDQGVGAAIDPQWIFNGPNASYSLSEARLNFEDHGDMYRFDERRIDVVSRPSRQRLALLAFVRNRNADDALDVEEFWRLLKDLSW